jgi:hypothetical protein
MIIRSATPVARIHYYVAKNIFWAQVSKISQYIRRKTGAMPKNNQITFSNAIWLQLFDEFKL